MMSSACVAGAQREEHERYQSRHASRGRLTRRSNLLTPGSIDRLLRRRVRDNKAPILNVLLFSGKCPRLVRDKHTRPAET